MNIVIALAAAILIATSSDASVCEADTSREAFLAYLDSAENGGYYVLGSDMNREESQVVLEYLSIFGPLPDYLITGTDSIMVLSDKLTDTVVIVFFDSNGCSLNVFGPAPTAMFPHGLFGENL